MITFATTGVQNYSVVALGEAFGTPLSVANSALTVNLVLSALGVVVGGLLAARITRHEWVAAISFAGIAVTAVAIGAADFGFIVLFALMSLNGFMNGVMQPSRDMIVRAVTPEGQFGKVFGFVTTGFQHRRHRRAADLRLCDGYRAAAMGVLHGRGLEPACHPDPGAEFPAPARRSRSRLKPCTSPARGCSFE